MIFHRAPDFIPPNTQNRQRQAGTEFPMGPSREQRFTGGNRSTGKSIACGHHHLSRQNSREAEAECSQVTQYVAFNKEWCHDKCCRVRPVRHLVRKGGGGVVWVEDCLGLERDWAHTPAGRGLGAELGRSRQGRLGWRRVGLGWVSALCRCGRCVCSGVISPFRYLFKKPICMLLKLYRAGLSSIKEKNLYVLCL